MTPYFDAAAALFQAHPSCNGRREDRLWLNVPGPVYGAETDNCATGRLEAPRHIHYGGPYFTEYVYRQPCTPDEVQDLLGAVEAEPMDGCAWDGDRRWTPGAVREWWRNRQRVLEYLHSQVHEWKRYDQWIPNQRAVEGTLDFEAYIAGGTEAGSLETREAWMRLGQDTAVQEAAAGVHDERGFGQWGAFGRMVDRAHGTARRNLQLWQKAGRGTCPGRSRPVGQQATTAKEVPGGIGEPSNPLLRRHENGGAERAQPQALQVKPSLDLRVLGVEDLESAVDRKA
ncbi:ferredoxin [Streptomyces sp. NPDC007863]|uniref:ferredoxin n=1 Tax=Streptomyces sp. NPDC007863 TaxID=3154894 RepID=UPI0033F58A7A